LNYSLRKLLKNRGAFSNDEAIVKIIYLAINRVAKKWPTDSGLEGRAQSVRHPVRRQSSG
jgi:transposase-like protein